MGGNSPPERAFLGHMAPNPVVLVGVCLPRIPVTLNVEEAEKPKSDPEKGGLNQRGETAPVGWRSRRRKTAPNWCDFAVGRRNR